MKKFLYLLIGIFIIILPLLLERTIGLNKFLWIHFETSISIENWVMFWGSYLGAIGTVVLGCIALRQNRTLSKANKNLNNILESYFDTISKPTFSLGKFVFFHYEYDKNLRKYSEDSIDTMYPVVLDGYECSFDSQPSWFARLMIPLKSQSDIPLADFRVSDFIWNINKVKYNFKDMEGNDYCTLPFEGELNLCNINLIYPGMTNIQTTEEFRKIGEDIQSYIEASSKKPKEKISRIEFDISIRNQIKKVRKFKVQLDLYWDSSMQLRINKYYINPYDMVSPT